MPNPQDLLLSSYDYELDPKLIAQVPIEPRHSAKLLVIEKLINNIDFTLSHKCVWELQEDLRPNDLLIVNDTKVLKARLKVKRAGGGAGELLLIEPLVNGKWLCLGRPAKRMKEGELLSLERANQESIHLKVVGRDCINGTLNIQFPECYSDRLSMEFLLNKYGQTPFPPYIKSNNNLKDSRYQTCYAAVPGAVAAPTAGLHLSDELLHAIRKRGVDITSITLHVGIGTFKPIQSENLSNLKLHSEWIEVNEDVVKSVETCKKKGGRVIAVGTTSVRALEAAFSSHENKLKPFKGKVNLVIQPGYSFNVIEGLITNFHLPKSSLLLLVSALIGRERLLNIYKKAIESNYRFFSYGDAMFIKPDSLVE